MKLTMKLTLTPVQNRILRHLAFVRTVQLEAMVLALQPAGELSPALRWQWEVDIRLAIDLLAVYGLITMVDAAPGERLLYASPQVLAWADAKPMVTTPTKLAPPSPLLPSLMSSVVATSLLLAACSTQPPQKDAGPVIMLYNAEGTAPPERMEQFYNPRNGQMVYRFCVGNECPEPTPKLPSQRQPRVTEIEADGRIVAVDQNADVIAGLNNRAEVVKIKPGAAAKKGTKGAPVDSLSANLASSLDDQRRELTGQPKASPRLATANPESMKEAGERAPTESPAKIAPPAAPRSTAGAAMMGATAFVPPRPAASPAQAAMPVPAAKPAATTSIQNNVPPSQALVPVPSPSPSPTATQPPAATNMPSFPTTGTRVPSAPSARAPAADLPSLAYATPAMQAAAGASPFSSPGVGTYAPGVHNGQSAEHGGAPASVLATATATITPAGFLEDWARRWAAKDIEGYFNLYADDFMPTYGTPKTVTAFIEQRGGLMARQGAIKVGVEIVRVEERDGKASIRFWQTYESKSFKSRVMKSLELVQSDTGWKIRRERLIPFESRTA